MDSFNNVKLFKIAKLALKYPTTSFNILTDIGKKKFLNQKVSPFPRLITLYITNKCNLNCPMCLIVNHLNKNQTGGISIKTIKKILPELKKYKPFVCITGGEPLLNKDLFPIINLLSKNKIITSMTTNGFLLEKYAQEITDSGLEFLSVSLDHYDEIKHDKGRGVKTTYKRLIRGLNKLNNIRRETPTNIKINTVIRQDNYRVLSKMYDFIESLGVDEWSVQHYSFTNPVARKCIHQYLEDNSMESYTMGSPINRNFFFNAKQVRILQKQLNEIMKKSTRYKTKLSIKPEIGNLFSYYEGKFPSKKSRCIWPFESINIMENSKVTLCLSNEVGNLNDTTSIEKIWNSEKAYDFQKLMTKERVLPLCFRCHGLKFDF